MFDIYIKFNVDVVYKYLLFKFYIILIIDKMKKFN